MTESNSRRQMILFLLVSFARVFLISDGAFAADREEGREEGLKKGMVDSIHLCQDLLKQARTPLEKLCILSINELQAKVDELKRALLG